MRFAYVLLGWEGSTGDARVLHDAVNIPNGLKVHIGNASQSNEWFIKYPSCVAVVVYILDLYNGLMLKFFF